MQSIYIIHSVSTQACQWGMVPLQAMVQPMDQRPKPFILTNPKFICRSKGKHDFTHSQNPLKHLIKTQVCNIKPEGETEIHSIKPQPRNKSKRSLPKTTER